MCKAQLYRGEIERFTFRVDGKPVVVERISQVEFLQWEREYEVFGEVSDRVKKKRTSWESLADFRMEWDKKWNLNVDGITIGSTGPMISAEPETSS
jgi:hypothetical protein